MQERIFFDGVDTAMRKSQGDLNPISAWEITELIYRSRLPNVSNNDFLKVEKYKERFRLSDSLVDQLLEVREKLVLTHMPGNNFRLSGIEAMNDFFFNLKI